MSISFSSSRIISIISFIALSVVCFVGYLLLRDLTGPTIMFAEDFGNRIGPRQEIVIESSDFAGVKSIEISVARGSQRMQLYEKTFSPAEKTVRFPFTLEDAKLPEGAFTLEVKAYDSSLAGFGKGNSTTREFALNLDNQPPRISVKTQPPSVRRGGSALIVYQVSEPVNVTGVYVNSIFFKAYEQEKNIYACLFPFPESVTVADFLPQIMAQDLAGNITESRLMVNARTTQFKSDIMNVTDRFLEAKKEELAKLSPDKNTPLEQYIEANQQARVKDNEILMIIGQDSSNIPQWKGVFTALPGSKVMASFGDRRTYKYKDEVIDTQVHQGIDLASVAKDKVPAANNGKVVFADPLGIYGNLIVIDHGLGLFSLYSHLTDMFVTVDEVVEKGHIVGTTGTTGLAGGDHVHFGIMISGVPVSPREWLDSSWLRNNITSRLNLAK